MTATTDTTPQVCPTCAQPVNPGPIPTPETTVHVVGPNGYASLFAPTADPHQWANLTRSPRALVRWTRGPGDVVRRLAPLDPAGPEPADGTWIAIRYTVRTAPGIEWWHLAYRDDAYTARMAAEDPTVAGMRWLLDGGTAQHSYTWPLLYHGACAWADIARDPDPAAVITLYALTHHTPMEV